jgi:hypothetical protein
LPPPEITNVASISGHNIPRVLALYGIAPQAMPNAPKNGM